MPDDEFQRTPPDELDEELEEGWTRMIDDPFDRDIRGVDVSKTRRAMGGYRWEVILWVAEAIRDEPLLSEMTDGIVAALRGVEGVTDVKDQGSRETWSVAGNPSGLDLIRAASQFVDGLADRARAYIAELDTE